MIDLFSLRRAQDKPTYFAGILGLKKQSAPRIVWAQSPEMAKVVSRLYAELHEEMLRKLYGVDVEIVPAVRDFQQESHAVLLRPPARQRTGIVIVGVERTVTVEKLKWWRKEIL
jgi:hypothetical protein